MLLALSSVLACHAVVDNFRFSAFDFIIVSVVWSVPFITSFITFSFSAVKNIVATCSLYFCVFH